MGGMLKQAQEAMAKMQNLKQELAMEEIEVDRGGVKVRINGVGEMLSIKIDPSLAKPEDVGGLEDAVLLAVREASAKSGELHKRKFAEATDGLPLPPGINPF